MLSSAVLYFFLGIAPLVLQLALQANAATLEAEEILVCSGPVPLGKILSRNGAYYAISDKVSNASGKCQCDTITNRLSCSVDPTFPYSTPQGPAICQKPGTTTCASRETVLCANGSPIAKLNSEGAVAFIGDSGKPSGYCQCMPEKTWSLRCPDFPTSSMFSKYRNIHINCSREVDCSGF